MLYTTNESNKRGLQYKESIGEIIRIYPRIYVDKEEEIIPNIPNILKYLNITGKLFYKSGIEYPKNITNKVVYILSDTNKKIYLGTKKDVKIEIYKKPTSINLIDEQFEETSVDGILKPKSYYGFLINFSKSNLSKKRSNKDLACYLMVKEILSVFGEVDKKDLFLLALKGFAKGNNLQYEYDQLDIYFNNYMDMNYKGFDEARINLFNNLASQLDISVFSKYQKPNKTILFYEAYFSNYIEGTEFEIDEAENIIFNPAHVYERHKDGNDIKKTYSILEKIYDNPLRFKTFEEFEDILKKLHIDLMGHRKDEILVGEYKEYKNKSGSIGFVLPSQLKETLREGFKNYLQLEEPMARAIYLHMLIAESHPFDDGNGRISRIMMNNELSAAGLSHIIIPTVFREDYIMGLKGFSHQGDVKTIIKAFIRAYNITNTIDWDKKTKEINEFISNNSGFDKDMNSIWGAKPSANILNKTIGVDF